MMQRLGLVVECYREGAEDRVLRCLTHRLSPNTELHVRCMGSKRIFKTDAVKAALLLLKEDKCEQVFLVWDLQPEWADEQGQDCDCIEECKLLLDQFPAGALAGRIHLICISYMLETWVVADERALSVFFSTGAYKAKIGRIKSPETQKDTKALLMDLCVAHRGKARRYQDRVDAVRILQRCPDTARLQSVSSFTRYVEKLTGDAEADFVRDGSVCNDLAATFLNEENKQRAFRTSR